MLDEMEIVALKGLCLIHQPHLFLALIPLAFENTTPDLHFTFLEIQERFGGLAVYKDRCHRMLLKLADFTDQNSIIFRIYFCVFVNNFKHFAVVSLLSEPSTYEVV